MKIGLLVIATGGERYTQYLRRLIDSALKFFPVHIPIIFTDSSEVFGAVQIYQEPLDWPAASLMRYHHFAHRRDFLNKFDYLFYVDADMLFVNPIAPEEFIAEGITAVLHPGMPQSFERRPASAAFVKGSPTYYQGCLVGGPAAPFLAMCETIAANIDADTRNGITAVWHDESHLNRYLVDNPPAKVLTPAFAWPEEKYVVWKRPAGFVPKILHLEKKEQGEWKDKPRTEATK